MSVTFTVLAHGTHGWVDDESRDGPVALHNDDASTDPTTKAAPMHLTQTLTHPFAVDAVFSMLTDREYVRQRAEVTGGSDITVDVTSEGEATVVKNERSVPASVPSFARGMVGDSIRISETHRWNGASADGNREGTFEVSFGNLPVRFTGTLALTATGDGSRAVIDGDVKASVPLFGGQVEKFVAEQVTASIVREQTLGETWLSGA